MKKSNFYAFLTRLRWIKRWGLKRNAYEENVMEHSWEVATIAHALAVIKNRNFNGSVDANAIAVAALYHDVTEVITGDLPTPIKYHSPAIQRAYKTIEQQTRDELLNILPEELQQDYQPLINEDLQPKVNQQIIKAADRISAYLKCQAELKAGNQEFETAAKRISADLMAMEQEEVAYFMRVFAPSCGLSLDALMQESAIKS
ncbi:MAG: 5'-deoxynucleotidase [Methyloprofundus sp.]|nr:5'-deoxynucleotidase [Methyloprofundus sp.]